MADRRPFFLSSQLHGCVDPSLIDEMHVTLLSFGQTCATLRYVTSPMTHLVVWRCCTAVSEKIHPSCLPMHVRKWLSVPIKCLLDAVMAAFWHSRAQCFHLSETAAMPPTSRPFFVSTGGQHCHKGDTVVVVVFIVVTKNNNQQKAADASNFWNHAWVVRSTPVPPRNRDDQTKRKIDIHRRGSTTPSHWRRTLMTTAAHCRLGQQNKTFVMYSFVDIFHDTSSICVLSSLSHTHTLPKNMQDIFATQCSEIENEIESVECKVVTTTTSVVYRCAILL